MHQTALKYEMEVSDGGRLELETPLSKGTRVVLFAAQESPDDRGDLAEASESAPGLWDDPIDDLRMERLPDWAGHRPDIPIPLFIVR